MHTKEKYLISFLLIALALSLLFNLFLINNNIFLTKNERQAYLSIIQIYKKVNNEWFLVFEKENDILKHNFANLTKLFFSNWHNDNSVQAIFIHYLSRFIYNTYNDFKTNSWSNTYTCNIHQVIWNVWNEDQNVFGIFGDRFFTMTFRIGFGNDTSIFSEFPSTRHNTTIISFGYAGSKCAEASHEEIDYGLPLEVQKEQIGNVIRIKYIGYWNVNYPNYVIKYVRLYTQFVWSYDVFTNQIFRDWLLIAEDKVDNVIGISGETLKFVYIIQVNL
jgi:hypothetical protein